MSENDTRSGDWIRYFSANKNRVLQMDWNDAPLSESELRLITPSLRQFQLGESSEGHHVMALAHAYAARSGDIDFPAAMKLFIGEEQRHSNLLARFLHAHGIPVATSDPVDSVFRLLRKRINLEMAVVAMLTAEVIAVPYYHALHNATISPLLKQICRQLLRDEMGHLRFQVDTLSKLRRNRSPLGNTITLAMQRFLLTGTLFIVWRQHRAVFKAGGFTWGTFWKTAWRRYHRTVSPKTPTTIPMLSRKERAS